jgi:hypothetical protein
MYNKKGGLAIGEIRGFFVYTFIAIVGILLFYGCSVFNEKKTMEEISISTHEINAIKSLNHFLEIPSQDKKVIDIIVESYYKRDYGELDKIAKTFFSEDYTSWALLILDEHGSTLYDSKDTYKIYDFRLAESELRIPISDISGNFEFVTLIFQIREKRDI